MAKVIIDTEKPFLGGHPILIHSTNVKNIVNYLNKNGDNNKVHFSDDGYVIFQNHVYKYTSELSDFALDNTEHIDDMMI